MHSVFDIGSKGLKRGYISKNRPFYINVVLFHFQTGMNIPRKIFRINSILPRLAPVLKTIFYQCVIFIYL